MQTAIYCGTCTRCYPAIRSIGRDTKFTVAFSFFCMYGYGFLSRIGVKFCTAVRPHIRQVFCPFEGDSPRDSRVLGVNRGQIAGYASCDEALVLVAFTQCVVQTRPLQLNRHQSSLALIPITACRKSWILYGTTHPNWWLRAYIRDGSGDKPLALTTGGRGLTPHTDHDVITTHKVTSHNSSCWQHR